MRALFCLLISSVALAAPVPPGPPPDPLGKGYMGVYATPEATGMGSLVISKTVPDSPAREAGLQPGDVIYRVGPLQPRNFDEVRNMIGCLRPGTRIRITVKRGGTETTTVLILANRPPNFGTIELTDPQP